MSQPIVVIDDEPDVLNVVCELLEDEGYSVICLGHPREATTCTVEPSFFLMDLMMPDMSGITLARWLRDDGYPDTPMVAMSASSRMLADASKSELFQGTISKPFDFDTLLRFAGQFAS